MYKLEKQNNNYYSKFFKYKKIFYIYIYLILLLLYNY